MLPSRGRDFEDHDAMIAVLAARGLRVVLTTAAAKAYAPGLSALVSRATDPPAPEAQRRADLHWAFFAPGHDETS